MRRPTSRPTGIVVVLAVALLGASCARDAPAETTAVPTIVESAPATTIEEEPVTTTPPTEPTPTTTSVGDAATHAAPTDIEVSDAGAGCRRLTDFDDDAASDWFVVNDGVMGGRSNGAIDIDDSVMRFTGSVVTAGGGFTSVRLRLDGAELAGSTQVVLRVRADQRTYGLTLEDTARIGRRAVSHRADLPLDPSRANEWTTVTVRYDALRPSVFGEPVEAPPFEPDAAREFGIIIADAVDGGFSLEVDWIDACP